MCLMNLYVANMACFSAYKDEDRSFHWRSGGKGTVFGVTPSLFLPEPPPGGFLVFLGQYF